MTKDKILKIISGLCVGIGVRQYENITDIG